MRITISKSVPIPMRDVLHVPVQDVDPVLYTDGITDVRPPHDLAPDALEELVQRAATEAVSATAVVDRLGRELAAILPIAERNDDIAILVLKVPSNS